jgi:hypothetical protein
MYIPFIVKYIRHISHAHLNITLLMHTRKSGHIAVMEECMSALKIAQERGLEEGLGLDGRK